MKIAPRQYRNQRLGRPKVRKQQQLLEVSIRRDKERERQVRQGLLTICKLLAFSALAAGAWVGTHKALQKLIWENPFFYLTDVRVTSDGTLTREQIISTGGVVEGGHIFSLDLDKVRTALSGIPQVDRVEIQRSFPHRLDIEVTERQPVAWVTETSDIDPTATDRSYLIDAHGYIMKSRKLLPEYAHLPLISGAVLENLAPGQRVKELELLAALDLLKLSGDNLRWQVRNIDVSKGYCLIATARDHAPIIFGTENLDRQWTNLNHILDYASSIHKEVQTANLLVERNTPVIFYDPDAVPPPPPPIAGPPAKPAVTGKNDAKAPAGRTDLKGKAGATPKSNKGPADVRKPFRMHG